MPVPKFDEWEPDPQTPQQPTAPPKFDEWQQTQKFAPLDDLKSFAAQNKLEVGSTTGGTHNPGSKHYVGRAIDIRNSGRLSNEQVQQLSAAAANQGLKLRDERVRPKGQAVWGGPHVHLETANQQVPKFDDWVSGQTPPPQSKLNRVTPQATASTPAGVSRQPSVPTAEQALKKMMDDVNRATGISQPRTQPRQPQAPFIDRTIPKMEDVLTAARNSPQTKREEELAKPEFQRLKQQNQQKFGGELARITHPMKSDDELQQEALGIAKEKVQQERQQPEIDQLANKYRGLIQGVGNLAGLHGNAGPSKWTAEALTSAGAQVAPLLSFGLKAISNPKFSPVGALLTDSDKANAVAELVNKHATALQQAATAEGADRNEASKWAQSVIAGTIASTPELAAMAVGLPAPVVFGAAGAAKSYGRGEPTATNIQKGIEGTAQGLAWEAPALSGVKKLIPKSAMVGAGTTAVDLASGAPLGEALKGGATNALMSLAGGRHEEAPKGETQTVVPDIEGTLAAREARVSPSKEVNIPERPETIAAQLEAVQQGTRPAVLVTRGTRQPNIPKGMSAVRTEAGTFYYDPKQVSRETIIAKVADGTYGTILGHVEPKSEATTEAVVARDAQGNEIQSSAVSPENVAPQAEVMKAQYPEASVETGGEDLAKQVIQERVAPPQAQSRTIATEEAAKPTTPTEVVAPVTEPAPTKVETPTPDLDASVKKAQESLQAAEDESTAEFEREIERRKSDSSVTEMSRSPEYRAATERAIAAQTELNRAKAEKYFAEGGEYVAPDPNVPVTFQNSDAQWASRLFPEIAEKYGAKPTTPTPTETAVEAKPTTPQAATPELQRHADEAAALRAKSTDALTSIERAALERKAARLDAKARGEQLRRSGADPYELIDDIIIRGGELIRAGKTKFDEWAKGVKDEFGKEADPHLKDVYAQLTGERKPTSIKNEATAELRHELDLTEMERPEKKSWETAIDNAEAKGLMDKTDEIADRIIKGNREEGLDYDESAALLVKTRELENKWEDTYKNNPNDPALNDIKAELDKVSKAVDMGGTDIARALGIRRAMMDKSFKLISLIRQAEKAKGRRVTADEVKRYDAIVKERDAAIEARDAALAKADAKASEVSTEKFIGEQKLKVRQQGRQRKQSELLTERAEIKQQIAQAWAKTKPKSTTLSMGGLGDLDPKAIAEMTRLLTQLARNHIESGVVRAVDLADAVHNEVKDVTDLSKREVSDLISGYGRVRKSTNDPIERKLNEIKSILAATSGKADVLEQATRPLRRGQQREKPTEDQRRALRELNEAMRERGPELGQRPQNKATEQATPLDKAKTTVRNRIEQLNTWLREGKREVEGRSEIIPDAELKRLREQQAGLERAARLLDDPAADAKAVEKRIGELDKSIAETQAKIRSGDISTKTAEGMSRWSKEIGEKQRELEVLKRIASDMRVEEARKAREAAKAQEPAEPFHGAEMSMSDFDKEAKRSLARVKVLEKQRAEWERKLLAREFGEQAKTRTPPTYNAEVRRAEIRAQTAEAKFTKEMERAKGGHQIRNISGMMKASLLGPSTMVKNFFGTAGWQGFEEQGRVFASLMDNAISLGRQAAGKDAQRGIMGLSPSAVWEATKYGARVGGRQALDILKRGATVEQMERHQYNEIDFGRTGNKAFDAGLKGMEVGFNSVFRILSASDRIFYQGAHRRNLIDRAQVIAKNEGLRGREAQQRARELVAAADAIPEKNAKGEKTSELVARLDADAKHDALVSTFNNDNTLSSKIRQFRAKVRNPRGAMSEKAADRVNALENLGMDFLVPFDRTPTNVVSRIVEASPLGYTKNVGQLVKAAINKGMDAEAQRNFSRTFGRASAGTVNMALGAALYGKLITIDDHDQAWLDLGFTKINLNTISPLGNIIGFGARMRKAYEKGDKATSGDYLKPALKEATNIPILRATQPIAEAAQQPDRSIPKTAARFVSMGIPFSGALRDIAKLTDKEDYRKPKGFTDTLKMGIPGLRQQVPVDVDRKATVDPLIQKFRSGRLGESDLQTAVDKGTITEAEAKRIKHEGGMSVQEADFSKKKPQDALDTYQRLSPSQRERVREIMERKAWSLLYSDSMQGDTATKERTRAKLQRQFDRLGITPKGGGVSGMRQAVQSAFA